MIYLFFIKGTMGDCERYGQYRIRNNVGGENYQQYKPNIHFKYQSAKQTQIKTDKHFEEELRDYPELLGDVKMKQGKMYKIYSYVINRFELIMIRSHACSCITII